MAEFLVKMADERGHVLQQVESGVSEQEIRERFVQQGFMVYSVKTRRGLLPMGGGSRKKILKADQFVIFNQQFLTLIKAGLPILKSLNILSKRQKNPRFKAILDNVQERVKSGELLSQAFEAQGATSKIYTTTLLAGERSGNLEEVLGRYIAFQRITVSFRKKLIASLWYPALLICALAVMLTFLMTYVVPQFADLYSSLNAKLPAITVFMLSIGRAIQNYYYLIIAAIGGPGRHHCAFRPLRQGIQVAGRSALPVAPLWRNLDEVPDRHVFQNAFHSADGRPAAGAIAGNRQPIH